MNRKKLKVNKILIFGIVFALAGVLLCHNEVLATSEDKMLDILRRHSKLFTCNDLGLSVLRNIGWGILSLLTILGAACADLFDICFGFVDFTTYGEVSSYIDKFKPVFIALICASLVWLGIILVFWHEKKPKFVMNLVLAVLVVTSSSFFINTMNGFIASDVRSEIMGSDKSSGMIYETIGAGIHDLLYLDSKVGLTKLDGTTDGVKNSDLTYDAFSEEQFETFNVNEIVDPDDGKTEDSQWLLSHKLKTDWDKVKAVYKMEELYDGVAWTDMLNEHYYRYSVDWWVIYLELISFIIVYLFMSYKTIRLLFEIVVHRLLAYLYSANLTNNQKILKILDSLKDSYIILIFITVFIKFYLMACKFISTRQINGISKGIILLFIAFVVIDGPNLIQKLTGIDAGLSDGMGKMMSLFYGSQMAMSVARMGGKILGGPAKFAKDHLGGIGGAGWENGKPNGKPNSGEKPPEEKIPPNGSGSSGLGENTPPDGQDGNEANVESRESDTFNQADNRSNQNQAATMNEHNDITNNVDGKTDAVMMGENMTENAENNSQIPPESSDQAKKIGSDDGKSSSFQGTSTMSQDRNMKDRNYHMQDIGKNLQSKTDTLNGMQQGKGERPADKMKHMDAELGRKDNGFTSADIGQNRPLDAGGSLLSKKMNDNVSGQSPDKKMAREILKNELTDQGGKS